MRRACNESVARLFRIEEFLMPQQIAAFFSRLAVQSRQQVDEGEIHEEDISAIVEEQFRQHKKKCQRECQPPASDNR